MMRLRLIFVLLCASHAASSRVTVAVTRRLAVPPVQARQAWLDYAWAAGGGLPFVASLVSADGQERTLLPALTVRSSCSSRPSMLWAAPI